MLALLLLPRLVTKGFTSTSVLGAVIVTCWGPQYDLLFLFLKGGGGWLEGAHGDACGERVCQVKSALASPRVFTYAALLGPFFCVFFYFFTTYFTCKRGVGVPQKLFDLSFYRISERWFVRIYSNWLNPTFLYLNCLCGIKAKFCEFEASMLKQEILWPSNRIAVHWGKANFILKSVRNNPTV